MEHIRITRSQTSAHIYLAEIVDDDTDEAIEVITLTDVALQQLNRDIVRLLNTQPTED